MVWLNPLKLKQSTVFRLLTLSLILGLTGILFARFVPSTELTRSPSRPEKVNLALRRTAHHLLRGAGDSTSRIPSVEQPDSQTFRVALARGFDYDQLPGLLQESFRLHRITGTYDVAVLDCEKKEIQLGYSVSDLTSDEPIPCTGRSLTAGCYVLQVTFERPATSPPVRWPLLAVGGVLVGFLLLTLHRAVQTRSSPVPPASVKPNLIHFGGSSLDLDNQVLVSGPNRHNLTYREAKLLRLLVSHPNQVLERDLILKRVWEDEGVTVGRSVDVFVSRLRKLLHDDPAIRIAAVHGVGYRLEVRDDAINHQ